MLVPQRRRKVPIFVRITFILEFYTRKSWSKGKSQTFTIRNLIIISRSRELSRNLSSFEQQNPEHNSFLQDLSRPLDLSQSWDEGVEGPWVWETRQVNVLGSEKELGWEECQVCSRHRIYRYCVSAVIPLRTLSFLLFETTLWKPTCMPCKHFLRDFPPCSCDRKYKRNRSSRNVCECHVTRFGIILLRKINIIAPYIIKILLSFSGI
jgi:hypothetical protein